MIANAVTCSSVTYDLDIFAKVPLLTGKTVAKATELVSERNLLLLQLDAVSGKQCNGVKPGMIARQGVPAGKRRQAGSLISYRLCEDKESSPNPSLSFSGRWDTNQGITVLTQVSPTRIAGSFGNGGTIAGSISGRVASGKWTIGNNSGPFSIELQGKRGNSFTGFCSGSWTGKRL